jgi:hypothetical protein
MLTMTFEVSPIKAPPSKVFPFRLALRSPNYVPVKQKSRH